MKYKKVKEKLKEKGFKIEYVQTYNVLDMVQFEHPDINGSIDVTFSSNNKIPQNILDGEEFDYSTAEWLENLNVGTICFSIDVSISYMSDETIDIDGGERENSIYIHGDDLKLFNYILGSVCNPYGMFDFIKKYNKEQEKFFNKIKKFLPSIQKYKLPHRIVKCSGNSSTLYSSFSVEFYLNDYDAISFNFSTLSFKNDIFIALKPGFHEENEGVLSIDCEISDFEKELDRQMNEKHDFEKSYKLYKENERRKRNIF